MRIINRDKDYDSICVSHLVMAARIYMIAILFAIVSAMFESIVIVSKFFMAITIILLVVASLQGIKSGVAYIADKLQARILFKETYGNKNKHRN